MREPAASLKGPGRAAVPERAAAVPELAVEQQPLTSTASSTLPLHSDLDTESTAL